MRALLGGPWGSMCWWLSFITYQVEEILSVLRRMRANTLNLVLWNFCSTFTFTLIWAVFCPSDPPWAHTSPKLFCCWGDSFAHALFCLQSTGLCAEGSLASPYGSCEISLSHQRIEPFTIRFLWVRDGEKHWYSSSHFQIPIINLTSQGDLGLSEPDTNGEAEHVQSLKA